jgi:hypothetical protein
MDAHIALTHKPIGSIALAAIAVIAVVPSHLRTRAPAIAHAWTAPSVVETPQPRSCDERLLGTWTAQTYRDEFADYHYYVLAVSCRDGELAATLELAAWAPDADQTVFRIAATIEAAGDAIHVDAGETLSCTITQTGKACSPEGAGYARDHFTGRFHADHNNSLDLWNADEAGNRHRLYRFYLYDRNIVDVLR